MRSPNCERELHAALAYEGGCRVCSIYQAIPSPGCISPTFLDRSKSRSAKEARHCSWSFNMAGFSIKGVPTMPTRHSIHFRYGSQNGPRCLDPFCGLPHGLPLLLWKLRSTVLLPSCYCVHYLFGPRTAQLQYVHGDGLCRATGKPLVSLAHSTSTMRFLFSCTIKSVC